VVHVLRADCREVLPTVPAGSIHACSTSSPHHGLRPTSGSAGELGQERTPERYIKHLVSVFRLWLRVLS
jgi:hypothetical protein